MFAVIYKFEIKEGLEEEFHKHWKIMTFEFRDHHGGLGSCLHKTDDGIYIAYAKWPTRELWEKKKEIINRDSLARMSNCLNKSHPAMPLEILDNLLIKI